MPCTVTVNPNQERIDIVYSPHVSAEDVRYAATERIRLQSLGGPMQVLIDASPIVELNAGAFDLVKLPQQIYVDHASDPNVQIAMLLPSVPRAREGAILFETACVNRGWLVKAFDRLDDAEAWLLKLRQSEHAVDHHAG